MEMEIDELMDLYSAAESAHQPLFAEQRSNLVLIAGLHYNKRDSRLWKRIREMDNVTKSQRLRLTKNHTQRICKKKINNLLAFAPGVTIVPNNDKELSDEKASDMHKSVWADIKKRHKMSRLTRQFAQDFVEIGEVICKVFYDTNLGHEVGYEEARDEQGMPYLDDDGKPEYYRVMSGDLVYERILGFNLLSDPEARSWEEVRWVCYRKMVPLADLEKQFGDSEELAAMIGKNNEQTYKIFDANAGKYVDSDGLTMLLEFYWRPCADYPKGWYAIATKDGVLHQDELPLGLFPIVYAGYDEASTSARSYSCIKQIRPYQAEVNRAASKIAEHQITLGDDKLLLMNGSAMAPGGSAHGVKSVQVTGQEPKILAGRNGEQYVGYMTGQISEMYQVAGEPEESEQDVSAQVDPYAMLFKTARQRSAFKLYISKFEEFQVELAELSLRLAKNYYTDEMMVPIVGKRDMVNIAEFRHADDLGYQIKVEPQSDDLETRFGRQLALNHLIQYAGAKMQSKDLAKVIKSMEYLNKDRLFDDDTIDQENADADILALDRGEQVQPHPDENHAYVIQRLTHRMKQKDFAMLPPQVQQNYQMKRQMHDQLKAQQIQQAQMASAGFIPTGGYLASCDLYMPSTDPTKAAKRVRLPSQAIEWLIKKLEQQGVTEQSLQNMEMVDQARVGQLLNQQAQQQQPASQPMLPAGVM